MLLLFNWVAQNRKSDESHLQAATMGYSQCHFSTRFVITPGSPYAYQQADVDVLNRFTRKRSNKPIPVFLDLQKVEAQAKRSTDRSIPRKDLSWPLLL